MNEGSKNKPSKNTDSYICSSLRRGALRSDSAVAKWNLFLLISKAVSPESTLFLSLFLHSKPPFSFYTWYIQKPPEIRAVIKYAMANRHLLNAIQPVSNNPLHVLAGFFTSSYIVGFVLKIVYRKSYW